MFTLLLKCQFKRLFCHLARICCHGRLFCWLFVTKCSIHT